MKRKNCRKCGKLRALSRFNRHGGMADGHINTCKDCHSEYNKQHYQAHKQAYVVSAARWQASHPEKSRRLKLAGTKRYKEKYPEKTREFCRIYKKNNPHKFAEYEGRRRALKVTTDVEKIDRHEIYIRDEGKCHICKRKVSFQNMELDHVKPLSRGGGHTAANLKVAHPRCNRKKWASIV